MKGVVGVAGPRMSPARTNSRALIKQPFTGGVITAPPANTHSAQPLLPSLLRGSYRGHGAGDPPPTAQRRNAGRRQEAEETRRRSEESNPSACCCSRQPGHCHRVGIQSSSCRGHLRPPSKPRGKAHYGHNSPLVRGGDTVYHSLTKKADRLKIAAANASQTGGGVYLRASRWYINMCIWTQAHGWGDKSQPLLPVFNKLMGGFMSLLLSLLQLAGKK